MIIYKVNGGIIIVKSAKGFTCVLLNHGISTKFPCASLHINTKLLQPAPEDSTYYIRLFKYHHHMRSRASEVQTISTSPTFSIYLRIWQLFFLGGW